MKKLRSEALPTRPEVPKTGLWWLIVIVTFLVLFVGTAIPWDALMRSIGSGLNKNAAGLERGDALALGARNGMILTGVMAIRIFVLIWISKALARFVVAKLRDRSGPSS